MGGRASGASSRSVGDSDIAGTGKSDLTTSSLLKVIVSLATVMGLLATLHATFVVPYILSRTEINAYQVVSDAMKIHLTTPHDGAVTEDDFREFKQELRADFKEVKGIMTKMDERLRRLEMKQ
jgi:hypothetical protein